MMNSFISELVSRFSIVVSDRIAASAVPVIGAVGGATINMIFMNHFQQIATTGAAKVLLCFHPQGATANAAKLSMINLSWNVVCHPG